MARPVRASLLFPGMEHALKGYGLRSLLGFAAGTVGLGAAGFVFLYTLSFLLALLVLLVVVAAVAFDGWRLPPRDRPSVLPIIVAGCFGLFFGLIATIVIVRMTVIEPYVVPSGSMRPTIEIGGRVIVNKISLGFRLFGVQLKAHNRPARGDIVVFVNPEDDTVNLKRIVGLPGETVTVVNEQPALINGEPLMEPYIQWVDWGTSGSWTVLPGTFFLMGDNRAQSRDSRHHGAVPRENLIGVVVLIYDEERGWQEP